MRHIFTREELLPIAREKPEALVDIILALQEEVLLLRQENDALKKQVNLLEKKVESLEARLAKNSGNSSKPPSSDGYSKPEPKSLRKPSGRDPGGQAGHPGHTLPPSDKPDFAVVHPLTLCPCGCGADLSGRPVVRHDKRQVFELPAQKLEVTEHRVEVKICPNCGREVSAAFPAGVNAPTQYGPRFDAWLVYLRVQQLTPIGRISQLCADLFGCAVSQATICAAVAGAHQSLAGFEVQAADLLAQAPLAHADETGLRVAGKLHWLHVVSTKTLTWYGVHAKRGSAALKHFGLLTRFTGRLIHDCWATYLDLDCEHGLCNAHLLRELVFVHEVLGQKWALRMLGLLRRMHRSAARCGKDRPLRQRAAWIKKYQANLREGLAANPEPEPPPGPRRRGRPKRSKAQNLLLRLKEHEASVLAFLDDPNVPFTNNQAEQDVRMMKVQQKVSGAFRTLDGAQKFARIRAYLSTVRKNRRDVFQEIVAALAGRPFVPSAA
jgi:transposase